MKIRPAVSEDVPRMRQLLEENHLLVDGIAYDLFTPPVLVCEVDEEIVGFIQAHVGSPYAVVTELAVARAHQRKGYAVKLVEHMETLLRYMGVKAWGAYTGDANQPVIDQLERYGARVTGRGVGFVKGL